MSGVLMQLPTYALVESATNPRTTFPEAKQRELEESIRVSGIIEPIIVRPASEADRYEICCGHRRHRAALAVQLETVPCIVRDLDDQEFRWVQLTENLQRADLTALDEADAYVAVLKSGVTVDELAARIGKSKSYVLGRRKLASLKPAGRDALLEGKIDDSTALFLARLPEKVQTQALVDFEREELDLTTFRERKAYVLEELARRLVDAPWKLDDATLYPEAGACIYCEKGPGNPEFRGSVSHGHVCTDRQCWDQKLDRLYHLKVKEAKGQGGGALKAAEAFTTPPDNGYGGWIAPHWREVAEVDETLEGTTLAELATRHGITLEPRITKADGRIYELVSREKRDEVLRAAGHKVPKSRQQADEDWRAAQARREERDARKRVEKDELLTRVYDATIQNKGLPVELLRALLGEGYWYAPDVMARDPSAVSNPVVLEGLLAVGLVEWRTRGAAWKDLVELVERVTAIQAEAKVETPPAEPEKPKPAKAKVTKAKSTKPKAAKAKPTKAKPQATKPKAKAKKKPAKKAAKKKAGKTSKKKRVTQPTLFGGA